MCINETRTFLTPTKEMAYHNGKKVTILRELGDDERDPECGEMYEVATEDGAHLSAFAEELGLTYSWVGREPFLHPDLPKDEPWPEYPLDEC